MKEFITNYNAPTIQRDDLLSINISSINLESSAISNFASNNANGNAESYRGNIVDHNGEIQITLHWQCYSARIDGGAIERLNKNPFNSLIKRT